MVCHDLGGAGSDLVCVACGDEGEFCCAGAVCATGTTCQDLGNGNLVCVLDQPGGVTAAAQEGAARRGRRRGDGHHTAGSR